MIFLYPDIMLYIYRMALIGFLASLYSFFVSIEMIAGGFKLFGAGMAQSVMGYTSNPFVSLSIGVLATALVQSSSSTTSLLVGMVAAGTISIRNAIPVVMGANIGTTVTNTLVSVGHMPKSEEFKRAIAAATVHDFFNIMAVIILLPLELIFHPIEKSAAFLTRIFGNVGGFKLLSPVKLIVKPTSEFLMHLMHNNPVIIEIVAITLLFLSLKFLVDTMKKMTLSRIERYIDELLFKNAAVSFLFGLLLTSIVQSSSVTTSLAVPFAAAGILSLEQIFPYTLGANIGTTVTAILAALITKNPAAITVAFSHLLFNIFGILVIYFLLKRVPLYLARKLAEIAVRKKWIVILYIVITFYAIPFLVFIKWR